MKNVFAKIAAGIFAFIIGVWIGDGFRPVGSFFDNSQKSVAENLVPATKGAEINGQIQTRFLKFTQAKDLYADFEITNGTNYSIFYSGYRKYSTNTENDKNNFCSLVAKQSEKWNSVDTNDCFSSLRKEMLTLHPGERAVFSVAKWDVKKALDLSDGKQEIKAQVGFNVFAGKDRTNYVIWNDEVRFPKTQD